jgi:hypothetical protein
MRTGIPLAEICGFFQVDLDLVMDFAEFGLYPTVLLDGEIRVEPRYIDTLKKIISLYRSLGINKEGIDVVLELRGSLERRRVGSRTRGAGRRHWQPAAGRATFSISRHRR